MYKKINPKIFIIFTNPILFWQWSRKNNEIMILIILLYIMAYCIIPGYCFLNLLVIWQIFGIYPIFKSIGIVFFPLMTMMALCGGLLAILHEYKLNIRRTYINWLSDIQLYDTYDIIVSRIR